MPLPEYDIVPECDLPEADVAAVFDVEPTVPDVERAFARLRRTGEYFRAWDGRKIAGLRYTSLKQNDLGLDNHFQGMMRLRSGPYAVVSGGDPHETMSHVFVIRLESRMGAGGGPWRSNSLFGDPIQSDTISIAIGLDPILWHGGGVDILGDILAVAIQTSDPESSRVVFLDMGDPENPKRMPPKADIMRRSSKAGAVALTKLPSGRYLCAVWSDSDKEAKKHGPRLDCYISDTTEFDAGFNSPPRVWYASTVRASGGEQRELPNFQAVNFIRQSDGELYLAGLHNTTSVAPVFGGDNEIHLLHVDLTEDSSDQGIAMPLITKVAVHRFECKHSQCNMDGAGGVHVATDGRLMVYSAFHFRMSPGPSRQVRFTEFRPHPTETVQEVTMPERAWFELYEKPYFEGRFFSVRGTRDSWITNYGNIMVQRNVLGFNDKVRSARFQIPTGMRYMLYENDSFKKPLIALTGTGSLDEITDFTQATKNPRTVNAARKTSSSRYQYLHPGGSWKIEQA